MPNREAFENAKKKIIGIDRQRLGIGTLSEKTVHAILKNYYQPDEDKQEIPIENYVADIYAEGEIIEIQTRQFDKMRGKLQTFLPLYPVTVVYPIPRQKWVIWIDEESGELSRKRKSPAKGNPYMVFPELYKIKMFLKDPHFHLRLAMLDMEEYKLLNGWGAMTAKGAPAAMTESLRSLCRSWKLTAPKISCSLSPLSWREPSPPRNLPRPPESLCLWPELY